MAADYAVDMSNIVREGRLLSDREFDLSRFDALIAALISYTRDDAVQVYGVADGSLIGNRGLQPDERGRLERWRRRGLIEVLTPADDRLLQLADTTGQSVISSDNFKDYQRRYPWISGNRDRFFWVVRGAGGVGLTLVRRNMPVAQEWEVSRKEEEGELLARGLYVRGSRGRKPLRELLGRRWLCPDPDCPLFGAHRLTAQPLPRYHRGAAACPTHRLPLRDQGGYLRPTQVKVRIDGVVRARFLLAADQELAVGRSPGGSGIALARWLDSWDAGRVSRSHVLLRWNGEQLRVQDTSRNGTSVRHTGRKRSGTERLPSGTARPLALGDEIVLAEGVELVPTGRSFHFLERAQGEPESVRSTTGDARAAARVEREASLETQFTTDPPDHG